MDFYEWLQTDEPKVSEFGHTNPGNIARQAWYAALENQWVLAKNRLPYVLPFLRKGIEAYTGVQ